MNLKNIYFPQFCKLFLNKRFFSEKTPNEKHFFAFSKQTIFNLMQTISLEHISWFLGQKRIYIISMHTSNPSIFYGLNETCVDFINILLLLKPYNYVSILYRKCKNFLIFKRSTSQIVWTNHCGLNLAFIYYIINFIRWQ